MAFKGDRGNRGSVGGNAGSSANVDRMVYSILRDLSYKKMIALLKNLMKSESDVKKVGADGKEVIDYPATLALIKTKCRQTLDDVEGVEHYLEGDDE